MADFVAVLKKTLDGLSDTSPPMREKVYDRARATIASKLTAMNPPLPPPVVDRQKKALEDAIAEIEKGYARHARNNADPLGELENVFASLKNPTPAPAAPRSRVEPPAVASFPARPAPVPPVAAVQPAADETRLPSTIFAQDDSDEFDRDEAARYPSDPERSETIALDPMRKRRGRGGWLVAAVIVLVALAAGGYGAWLNRDRIQVMLAEYGIVIPGLTSGASSPSVATVEPAVAEPDVDVAPAPPEPAAVEQPAEAATTPPPAEVALQKFTQKLGADGVEVDVGPATVEPILGEGTSVAAATTGPEPPPQALASADLPPVAAPSGTEATPPELAAPTTPAPPVAEAAPPSDAAPPNPAPPQDAAAASSPTQAADAAPATTDSTPPPAPGAAESPTVAAVEPAATTPPPAPAQAQSQTIPVGQRAIFYEERTNVAEASAESGSIVWSMVQESPGGSLPPEPVIRAEATIPGKDVQLRMTIRRNTDQTLPASHIVEMIFLTPQGFEGGGIDTVLRISMKNSEQEAGKPLQGIPAKIADGFFLIALNDTKTEIDANMGLLRDQSWIDVPIQYKNGRRALFTMEKGIPGAKVFDDAVKAWQVATASAG